ncbi:molybdenum cofactor biosynthesis protein MoaF [Salibacterium salarium]|uniref:Molybdenum cofactor biosynthesis protein MoaF n=1 Tax=Salibacterium salarium TaxID=284579 RepID=A0A3R9WNS5_9BACI|nr:MoaF C-terminal domain-containing protein [Salibacterium salarium]RSL30313.1 molybdenum cofactor biosynthesis protein MoaF [Salibacterium salarium]
MESNQEFISVGELSVGFSENIMKPTDNLVGKHLNLYSEEGTEYGVTFVDVETLKWSEYKNGEAKKFICQYTAVMPRNNLYLVDFIVSYGDTFSISLILDIEKNIATKLKADLPASENISVPMLHRAERGESLTSVKAVFEHLSIDQPFTSKTPTHQQTTELIGETIEFDYSHKDKYEHIYLNENRFTWHCLEGSEKGLADTDQCYYYKLADQLYLFVWLEKVIPTVGLVVEDLSALRSYGKIFGYEGFQTGRVSNFPVGSYARIR